MKKRKVLHALRPENRRALLGDFVLEDTHYYCIDRHSFTIYVGGDPYISASAADRGFVEPGVEHHMADRFDKNLDILSGIDPERPILIKMSSCGGYWDEGMQMFSAILSCPNPVTVLATKWARSMTSLIPLAADRFVMRLPAQYMFHGGSFSFEGLNQEADTADLERRKAHEIMLKIYVARLRERGIFHKQKEKDIRDMLDERMRKRIDVWLSTTEAERWGFVDAIFDGDFDTLRAEKRNEKRRQAMLSVLRAAVDVKVRVG